MQQALSFVSSHPLSLLPLFLFCSSFFKLLNSSLLPPPPAPAPYPLALFPLCSYIDHFPCLFSSLPPLSPVPLPAEVPVSSVLCLSSVRELPVQVRELYAQGFVLVAVHPFVHPCGPSHAHIQRQLHRAVLVRETPRYTNETYARLQPECATFYRINHSEDACCRLIQINEMIHLQPDSVVQKVAAFCNFIVLTWKPSETRYHEQSSAPHLRLLM